MLDLHEERGIHAWRCLSHDTEGGGSSTFADCNFGEIRQHYMRRHAHELSGRALLKWKKGYYTLQGGHVVANTAF